MSAGGARIVVVADDAGAIRAAGVTIGEDGVVAAVDGGAERRDSVAAGLRCVPDEVDVIAVHDAARPLAEAGMLDTGVAALIGDVDGAIPVVAVRDTIKRVDAKGHVHETLDRDELVAVQTPQVFRAGALRRAHDEYVGKATDDASMVEGIGGVVATFDGSIDNIKITYEIDLDHAGAMLAERAGS